MVDYFKQRQGPIAKAGIGALKKSLAAIYYLPFQCGVNLFFRFSGQSIPNRCAMPTLVDNMSASVVASVLSPCRHSLTQWQGNNGPGSAKSRSPCGSPCI